MAFLFRKNRMILFFMSLCIVTFYFNYGLLLSSSIKDTFLQQSLASSSMMDEDLHNEHIARTAKRDEDINHHHQQQKQQHQQYLPVNRLVHVTIFGLGHRLCRTTAAWHLAKVLNLTQMVFQWGTCGTINDIRAGPKIFPYLFGIDTWEIPSSSSSSSSSSSATSNVTTSNVSLGIVPKAKPTPIRQGKTVLVRNDVYGYVPGQNFKNVQLPIPPFFRDQHGPFLQKLESDVELYQLLMKRYRFRHHVDQFMEQHHFSNHTVIGLHLRAGNGEQSHFTESGRYIANETQFVSNLLQLLHFFLDNITTTYPQRFDPIQKPPLLFLATDTAYLVPTIVHTTAHQFHVPTVILPQIRLPDNQGVTFRALQGAGEKCLQGWRAMVSDMFLLSQADVLIAARHSSFTQSLPLSILFDHVRQHPSQRRGPNFCEVSSSATTMTCLEDLSTWLFRKDPSKMITYILPSSTDRNINSKSNDGMDDLENPVVHKLLVLLPDLEPPKEFPDVVSYLTDTEDVTESNAPNHGVESSMMERNLSYGGVRTHTYGAKRFNPKYRFRKRDGSTYGIVPTWKLIDHDKGHTHWTKITTT